MVAAASGNRRLLTHQSALITALPDDSTLAIADGSGKVLQRCVHHGMCNAHTLGATRIAYRADSDLGSTSIQPGQQINEYFVGTTFDAGGNQTADGTFNPRQQSLLAADLGAIQQGVSADDPLARETGFQAFLGRHYQAIALGASAVAGASTTLATAGFATPWVAAGLGCRSDELRHSRHCGGRRNFRCCGRCRIRVRLQRRPR